MYGVNVMSGPLPTARAGAAAASMEAMAAAIIRLLSLILISLFRFSGFSTPPLTGARDARTAERTIPH